MPRQARVDIAGGLYHVIGRGNERRDIFCDDADYKEFYARVKQWVLYLMREKGGVAGVELSKELGLSSGAISHLCQNGRELVEG